MRSQKEGCRYDEMGNAGGCDCRYDSTDVRFPQVSRLDGNGSQEDCISPIGMMGQVPFDNWAG
jgi:hypothetical protein